MTKRGILDIGTEGVGPDNTVFNSGNGTPQIMIRKDLDVTPKDVIVKRVIKPKTAQQKKRLHQYVENVKSLNQIGSNTRFEQRPQ